MVRIVSSEFEFFDSASEDSCDFVSDTVVSFWEDAFSDLSVTLMPELVQYSSYFQVQSSEISAVILPVVSLSSALLNKNSC